VEILFDYYFDVSCVSNFALFFFKTKNRTCDIIPNTNTKKFGKKIFRVFCEIFIQKNMHNPQEVCNSWIALHVHLGKKKIIGLPSIVTRQSTKEKEETDGQENFRLSFLFFQFCVKNFPCK
jgi:hypothetical protein